jgi:RNA polymerase sigma-70 factor (ECF subfamily)
MDGEQSLGGEERSTRNELLALWSEHRQSVRWVIGAREVARDDIDDVEQTVFMKALMDLDRQDELPPCPEKWLRCIARHEALNFRQKQRRDNRGRKGFDESALANGTSNEAERSTEEEEMSRLLWAAVESLGPTMKRILQWRFLEGQTFIAIAAALNVSHAAARRQFQRALQLLRERLQNREDGLQP